MSGEQTTRCADEGVAGQGHATVPNQIDDTGRLYVEAVVL